MPPEATCANCRHFEIPNEADSRHTTFGKCSIADSRDGNPRSVDVLAFACDAEGYYGFLYVKPHFGCVQFAQADEEV